MYWKTDSILEWSDFPEVATKGIARFHVECGIEFFMEPGTDSIIWHLDSYFDPTLSWATAGAKTNKSLSIAKCYYEITEIWARKTRRKFIELDALHTSSARKYYREYKRMNRSLDRDIRKFSRDVDGGQNSEQYVLWRENIMQELKGLSSYKMTCRSF